MNEIYLAEFPIIKTKFYDHENVKEELLQLIDQMPDQSIRKNLNSDHDEISKTDWSIPEEFPRPYLEFIKPKLIKTIYKSFEKFQFTGLAFTKFWFQQYQTGDTHGWHTHQGCHFTNVYFVELPDNNFRTEIQSWNRSKIIDYFAEEGDIISFPSILYHRSPRYYNSQRKTIISFNLDLISQYV